MLICEVLEFCLGGQLFAALPVVIEGIAGPCKNMCFSSFEKLQLFQQIQKKKLENILIVLVLWVSSAPGRGVQFII